jgi:hypothetical protein
MFSQASQNTLPLTDKELGKMEGVMEKEFRML